ncbi:MAG: hypothetical protein OXS30_04635 [Chloroflexota bacterium]|nr:hypothetical protein [Chloroflexota bacterium]
MFLAPEPINARLAVRRHSDGQVEFALRADGFARVLPASRLIPAEPAIDRWLQSSIVILDGEVLGRISARRLADERTELSFLPEDGSERILPAERFLLPGGKAGWTLSSTFQITRWDD